MSRQLANWIAGYKEYSSESEAPDTYHLWAALSALASAVRRNLWLNQGIYLLYPNLYVIFVAPPGKIGKSTVLRMARKLLFPLENVKLGPDSVTQEELVRVMSKTDIGGQSALTIHASELSSLIEPSGIKMLQFLTDIYDCEYDNPAGWRYSTKGSGRDVVQNPVLNLLAATTPSWIAEGFPEKVISHGFTSRTMFVYADQTRFDNPFPKEPSQGLIDALVSDLKHIATLEGVFEWSPEAREAYADYYETIRASPPQDYRIEGYHWRKRTHILKVAMLLSIAEDDDLVIRPRDIEAATEVLEDVEETMPRTFSAVGKYDYTPDLERIWAQIKRNGGIPSWKVYEDNYAVGPEQIHKIMQGLVSMNRVEKVRMDPETGEVVQRGGELWFVPKDF